MSMKMKRNIQTALKQIVSIVLCLIIIIPFGHFPSDKVDF
jgi:hypothetical protein